MELLISSVWRYVATEEKIRIISLKEAEGRLVAYPLVSDRKQIIKPFILEIDEFSEFVKTDQLVECSFPVPGIMLLSDEALDNDMTALRDKRYEYIRELVNDHNFPYEYTISNRSPLVSAYASASGLDIRAIYRSLRDYWRYGLTKNALLPLRSEQGGPGKEKLSGHEKRGRPIAKSNFGFDFGTGINISKEDKKRIKKGYDKHYADSAEKSFQQAYDDTISEFYAEETLEATRLGIRPKHPSIVQFKYWGGKLVDQIKVNVSRKPKGDFEKNQRGITQSVMVSASFPGKVFEIDSTPADVHVVSPLNRTLVLGRPTIYSIIDRASRMIVGFYICLNHPSWEAARLAILHAFSDKVEYCKQYGIDIKTSDWPCHHVPAAIIGDRGELKGKVPCEVIPTTGADFEIAPVDRPDMKGLVENSFREANRESLHHLPGTTKGRQRKRMEPDPRLGAMLTPEELTSILIRGVLKHNNDCTYADLATDDLIKANIKNTPLNYWNFYISKHRHFLRKKPLSELKALLLPKIMVNITKKGIHHKDIYYTCDLAEKGNWYALARVDKEWKIEARFDENRVSELYIRPHDRSEFILCHLTGRSKRYQNAHYSDLEYIKEWKRSNIKDTGYYKTNLDNFNHKKEIVKNAEEEQRADQIKHKTKKSNVVNMRQNRRAEIERLKAGSTVDKVASEPVDSHQPVTAPESVSSLSSSNLHIFSRLWEDSADD